MIQLCLLADEVRVLQFPSFTESFINSWKKIYSVMFKNNRNNLTVIPLTAQINTKLGWLKIKIDIIQMMIMILIGRIILGRSQIVFENSREQEFLLE